MTPVCQNLPQFPHWIFLGLPLAKSNFGVGIVIAVGALLLLPVIAILALPLLMIMLLVVVVFFVQVLYNQVF